MSNPNTPEAQIEAARKEISADLAPAIEKLEAVASEHFIAVAKQEGYSDDQAKNIDLLARLPLIQDAVDGVPAEESFVHAYQLGRRQLALSYYENVLNKGKGYFTAFLTLIELEKQLAERRGEPAPEYPQEALIMACEAAEMAAEEGLSIEEQVATGFAMLRKKLGQDLN